jgi:hypothetical protein
MLFGGRARHPRSRRGLTGTGNDAACRDPEYFAIWWIIYPLFTADGIRKRLRICR